MSSSSSLIEERFLFKFLEYQKLAFKGAAVGLQLDISKIS